MFKGPDGVTRCGDETWKKNYEKKRQPSVLFPYQEKVHARSYSGSGKDEKTFVSGLHLPSVG